MSEEKKPEQEMCTGISAGGILLARSKCSSVRYWPNAIVDVSSRTALGTRLGSAQLRYGIFTQKRQSSEPKSKLMPEEYLLNYFLAEGITSSSSDLEYRMPEVCIPGFHALAATTLLVPKTLCWHRVPQPCDRR
jgi:hypothetical protein